MSGYDQVITIQRVETEIKSKNPIFGCDLCPRSIQFKSKHQLLHHITRNHKNELSSKQYNKIKKIVRIIEQAYQDGVLLF
ncbi:MAG: hypothetical protein COA77_04260 [Thaumarchaeota archaeon]|nr:MAG: hypothetical protein COA77_04260 [Nitrososphaerota archaeon]